jgi:hypothetical protein
MVRKGKTNRGESESILSALDTNVHESNEAKMMAPSSSCPRWELRGAVGVALIVCSIWSDGRTFLISLLN